MCRDCLTEDAKSPRSLCAHARKRDHLGIPMPCPTSRYLPSGDPPKQARMANWNKDHKQLKAVTLDPELRPALEQNRFVMAWFQGDHQDGSFEPVTRDISSETSVEDEIASINDRQNRAANLLRQFTETMNSRVVDIPDVFPPEDAAYPLGWPNTLVRMWHKDSHTKYSRSLGFQCSDWRNAPPAASFDILKMHEDEMRQSLESHLDGRKDPSRWISVTDNMGWILRHAPKWQSNYIGGDCRVAIISVPKMNRLGILWERSDDLTKNMGLVNVKHAWREHVLVYGWIPAQCLIRVVPFAQFRSMCEERGIPAGRKVYDPSKVLESLHAKEQCDEAALQGRMAEMQI